MKVRLLALLLTAVAAVLHYGLLQPARQDADAAFTDWSRARAERLDLERASRRRENVETRLASASMGPDALAALRRGLVASVQAAGLTGVRINVKPGRAPVAANVRLTAQGSFADVVRLSYELTRPGRGLLVERIRLAPVAGAASVVSFEMDATALGPLT